MLDEPAFVPFTLSNWEVHEPSGPPSAVLSISAKDTTVSAQAGALVFTKLTSSSKYAPHIFSPIGYRRCTLVNDWWQVLPTFSTTAPKYRTVQATTAEICDEDGTAMFQFYDSAGSHWPIEVIPRSAYVWIRFAGAA